MDEFRKSISTFWEDNHKNNNVRFLTGSSVRSVWGFLEIQKYLRKMTILNVGLGLGRETEELYSYGVDVYGLDISQTAIDKYKQYLVEGYTDSSKLPKNKFDIAVSHLVAQHMNDFDLIEQIKNVLKSLKSYGLFAIQYASPIYLQVYREDLQSQMMGLVRRTEEHMDRVVDLAGGRVIHRVNTKYFEESDRPTDSNCWNGIHVASK